MRLNSLARRTDLIFAHFEGEVLDRGEYIAVKTRSNPGYHWGNYLIFAQPPDAGSLARWQEIFRREFDYYPVIRHMVFAWEPAAGNPGEVAPFEAAGFSLERGVVLSARRLTPPERPNHELRIRTLDRDQDWEQALENQLRCRNMDFPEAGYREFKQRQFATYRALADAGQGDWFGAFKGETLVADLGIFHADGLGRYQNVGTHPDHRRQGICATLVHAAGEHALKHWKLDRLVMEADADYHAARIYESVGFDPVETNYSLCWWE